MSSQHHAKFTWGAGPQSVFVAGGFNNWSDSATPLAKQPDGSFGADVPLPWGEKQAFKYVVDGEWKVREDEAKEWDAAGNMNNVYTAPSAPASAPVEPSPAAATTITPASVPPASTPDTSAPTKTKTEPSTLLAASAPGAASAGTASAPATAPSPAVPVLGGPIGGAPAVTDKDLAAIEKGASEPLPDKIEKVAANANVGAATAGEEGKSMVDKATELGGAAVAALGAAVGTAALAVEKATGVDLHHGSPLTVDEAKAKGINVDGAAKVDAQSDTTSSAGTKPPASGIAALDEKIAELKVSHQKDVAAVPLPNGEAPKVSVAPGSLPPVDKAEEKPKHDIPAQNETKENHSTVPMPVITPVSAKDPAKDRSVEGGAVAADAGSKPISSDPSAHASQAKKDAEYAPPPVPLNAGETPAAPDAKSKNLDSEQPKSGASLGEAGIAPPTPTKDATPTTPHPAAAATTPTSVAPATPAKTHPAATNGTTGTPASITSTSASTPAKSGHGKEATGGSDVRKRKSSIFAKLKQAFSPKEKEKK